MEPTAGARHGVRQRPMGPAIPRVSLPLARRATPPPHVPSLENYILQLKREVEANVESSWWRWKNKARITDLLAEARQEVELFSNDLFVRLRACPHAPAQLSPVQSQFRAHL